jgi:hypothetical protein
MVTDTAKHINPGGDTASTPVDLGSTEGHQGNMKMNSKAKIKTELAVGVTEEIKSALEIATEFQGMKPSQYGRQAILEKLVREGFMKHPMQRLNSEAAE